MKRIKAIDTFRGLSMLWMFVGHLQEWWLTDADSWLYYLTFKIVDPIGSSAFIFIAGITTAISIKARFAKAKVSDNYNYQIIRKEYFYRATLIFLIAILYNSIIALSLMNPLWIWTWFVLLTVSISLLMAWYLMKILIIYRMIIGVLIWIIGQLLLLILLPYQNQFNIYGVFFHILYHRLELDIILFFFPFFIFGTIIGELLYKFYNIEDKHLRRKIIVNKFILPIFWFGISLIIFGVFFQFPKFLINRSFPWLFYTLGINITLLAILITFEEFPLITTEKGLHFLFYFSYYSLTIYLSHNFLYFIFFEQLNIFNIWIFILITCVITGLMLRMIYKRFGSKLSLKVQIGRLAYYLAKRK
ncbi:MAG: hypothetical protein ACFE85_15190 [Candidatus Hodarchaeota archaeon]